jgi:hypothetical protein
VYRRQLTTAAIWIATAIFFVIVGPWELAAWFLLTALVPIAQAYKNKRTGTTSPQRRHLRKYMRLIRDAHREITFDEKGMRSGFPEGRSTFYAWDDISKIELLSFKSSWLRGPDLYLLFYGPGDKTQVVVYNEAPLDMLQEIHRLPGFDIDTAMRPLSSIRENQKLMLWERAPQEAQPVIAS